MIEMRNFTPAHYLYGGGHSWWCVGPTYSRMIYDIMCSRFFKNVLEVGCADGYSTHSFISAIKNGIDFEFTICDVNFQKTVLQMIDGTKVKVENKKSIEVISKQFDFIFVDGSHDMATVGEEISMLLDCGTDTILAHDTFINHPDFTGAVLLKKVFNNHKDYLAVNFNGHSQNDQTHYGMSLFTKRKEVFDFVSNYEPTLNIKAV